VTAELEIGRFVEDLHRDVRALATATGEGEADEAAFTEHMIDSLQEFGELDEVSACHYEAKGVKVSGYGVSEDGTTLDLLVSDCDWGDPPGSFSQARVLQSIRRARAFFIQCLKGLHEKLEESGPAYDMAEHIHQLGGSITRVRIFVFTDGISKSENVPDEEVDGVFFTYQVWDAERLFRCQTSGKKREPIVVDFAKLGGPIPVLSYEENSKYDAYLAIVPGKVLATLYEKWGSRLLERNVRTFLQALGKVNRGIRETIRQAPEMFFTYNNGISTTAENAELIGMGPGQRGITQLDDFQIVNGGQTTASIFNTYWKDKADLTNVSVVMKLTVVKRPELMEDVVRDISRYSNTQNNVSTADFESNDPFHRRIEELSRITWAPDPQGGKGQTRWFYERARGAYNDERARQGTRARIEAWEIIHPPRQKITKTDLAKYEHSWQQLPYLVSLGAQKNFAHFSVRLKEARASEPDEDYFRDLIGKTLLFRKADATIDRMQLGGYKAQVTAYTVSWLSHLTAQRIDLDRIWQSQDLSPALYQETVRIAKQVYDYLTHPPDGRNITEWCKDQKCWDGLVAIPYTIGPDLVAELLTRASAQKSMAHDAEQANEEQQEFVTKASAIPGEVWLEMSSWAKLTQNLESWQRGIIYTVGKRLERKQTITWKQAKQALKAREQALQKGFKPKNTEDANSK